MDKRLMIIISLVAATFLIVPIMLFLKPRSSAVSSTADHYTALNLAAELMEETLNSTDEEIYSYEKAWNSSQLKKYNGTITVTPVSIGMNQSVSMIESTITWQALEGNVIDMQKVSLVSIRGEWP